MKTILIVFFILISLSGYTQDLTLSKTNLMRIFSQNAKGTLFDWKKRNWDNSKNRSHKEVYNIWQTSNLDNAYYNSDTIVMYNYRYAYFEIKGGETKNWHFYKKNKIGMSEGKYTEPPRVSNILCCKRLKIKKKNNDLLLMILMGNEVVDKFQILDLTIEKFRGNPEKPMYVLTLKRLKTA